MKQKYQHFNFRANTLALIETANEIIDEYAAAGLTLTLRQLYYQFVARDLLPNSQRSYNNLGNAISNGRLAGLIDWDAIEDRTRFLRGNPNHPAPHRFIENAARDYHIYMWANQPTRLEVWIEKDALVGVIERVCSEYDVDYFACRGYVSQSELREAGERAIFYKETYDQDTMIIHLGDHDPSGIDMTRDNRDRLTMFSDYGYHGATADIRRIALNMDQIEEYSPPPNPAKLTDARARGYIEKFGKSSWELDALEPRVMGQLIRDTIWEYRDVDLWAEREAELERRKEILAETVKYAKGQER